MFYARSLRGSPSTCRACLPPPPPLLTCPTPTHLCGPQRCMRVAVDKGFALAVHLHLDDGGNGGTWRNALDFEPYTK